MMMMMMMMIFPISPCSARCHTNIIYYNLFILIYVLSIWKVLNQNAMHAGTFMQIFVDVTDAKDKFRKSII